VRYMRLFATYRFGCAGIPGLRSPRLLRFARNDNPNGRHCEEWSDEAISMRGSMGGVIGLVPTARISAGKAGGVPSGTPPRVLTGAVVGWRRRRVSSSIRQPARYRCGRHKEVEFILGVCYFVKL